MQNRFETLQINYPLIAGMYVPFVEKIDAHITADEITEALPVAFRKLERIWATSGDDNGKCRSFDYVAQIIAETVYAQRVQDATISVESLIGRGEKMPKCAYCGDYIDVGDSFINLENITAHVGCLNEMDVDAILSDLGIDSNAELCSRLGYTDNVMEGEEDWTI